MPNTLIEEAVVNCASTAYVSQRERTVWWVGVAGAFCNVGHQASLGHTMSIGRVVCVRVIAGARISGFAACLPKRLRRRAPLLAGPQQADARL